MRNLKRALSLTLASVMLLGMMIVGTSAASYPDVDDNDNVEAIEVLNAVGVMVGDNGNFKPDAPVTRNEMAVIMAKLLLGTYEADSYVGTHPFNDVPTWANRYVAACYASGIVAGRSATTYDGSATVTAVEAAAMMLRALGYEDLSKNAARWDQPVAAKANEINLFVGLNGNGNAAMDRNSVAKLSLNALKSTMVTTIRDGISGTLPGGIEFTSNIRYADRNKIGSYDYTARNDDNGLLELCEFLYDGKLTVDEADTDDFGRTATTWTYDGEKVVTVAEKATKTYIESVKYKEIYKDLNLTVASQTASLTEDGEPKSSISLTKNSADSNKLGGNGTVVEVYKDGSTVNICVINTYLAQVSGDYNEKDEQLTIAAISNVTSLPSLDTTLDLEDFANLPSFKDDDYVLFTAVTDGITSSTVKSIVLAETVTGTVTSYTKNADTTPSDVTFNGSTRKYSAKFDANGQSTTYAINEESVFILDTYGYVIGLDEVAGSNDYVFIKEFDTRGEFSGEYIADAYFPDGSHQTITLNKVNDKKITGTTKGAPTATLVAASGNNYSGWYTYTVKDGKYNITKLADNATDAAGAAVNNTSYKVTENGKVQVYSKASTTGKATNDTVLVVKDGNKITTYTGIKNFPTITPTNTTSTFSWVATKNGYVTYMFVDKGDATIKGANSSSSDVIFILSVSDKKEVTDSKDNTYYVYDAVVNGTKGTVKATASSLTVGLYTDITYDEDGYVDTYTKIADGGASGDHVLKTLSGDTIKHSGGVVETASTVLVLNSDCVIRVLDGANNKTVNIINNGEALAKKYDGKTVDGTLYAIKNDDGGVTSLYVSVTGTAVDPASCNHTTETSDVTTPADCTNDEQTTYTCSACGNTRTAKTGNKLGHNWVDGSVTSAATCTATGTQAQSCSRCAATQTKTLEMIPHVDDNDDGNCDSCNGAMPSP